MQDLDMIDITPLAALTATPTSSPTSIPASPMTPSSFVSSPLSATSVPKRPADPLAWLWQCHVCHRTYRLAVTRRCLDDGHRFCAGVTIVHKKDQKPKVKRHRACASEFDYNGWKAFGAWRRAVSYEDADESDKENINASRSPKEHTKDCWNKCDYPSQCRWGDRFSPVESKGKTLSPVNESMGEDRTEQDDIARQPTPKTSFEDMLGPESQSENSGRESRFHEHMEDVDPTNQTDQAVPPQTICDVVASKSLDDLEFEIRRSILRVSELATEAMLQFRYPSPSTEPRPTSRRNKSWRKDKSRGDEVAAF
ncbi:hypothetical protein KVT40_009150 [Elsinoe batatas]|uniref:Uncharacterized protein n=1 Tax=Elsinoe batatas TaxID=2601811 RepID=A0A8K0KWQ4_9PEZI|nr:hypothetical protein KVT40_009150 [Elsinoe batatas]